MKNKNSIRVKGRRFLILSILALHATLYAQERPNVVLVMVDDMSHNDFTYFNSNGPRTPNIDMLAEQSVRLNDFHVSPTCSPTRGALMTGRHNDAVGVWHTIMGRYQLRSDEITMADVFKHNGYATGIFFKWHLGDNYPFRPGDRGFDYVAWHPGGGVGQQPDYWGNTHLSGTWQVNGELVKMVDEDDGITGAFSTNFFFNRAFEFMEENITNQKPFFVYLPTATAHSPQFTPPDAQGSSGRTATIENIDKNMGNLLDFLEQKGIAKNTILVFTTDNGGPTYLRGGKASHYEGGTRVPCFIRWEDGGMGGVGKDRDVEILCAHIDWVPTFMDILGFEDVVPSRPDGLELDGVSLKTALDSDPSNDLEVFKQRTITIDNQRLENLRKYKQYSVMKDEVDADGNIIHKWRLVGDGANSRELYDLITDERQTNNIIGRAANSAIVAELRDEYEKWWTEISARGDEYTRVIIGHPAEPVTRLNSHDFHTASPWNQGLVAQGNNSGTFIAVEFAKPGTYHFDLRRWPKEVEDQSTLTTAPPGKVFSGVTPQAFPIASARIRIWYGDSTYADETKDADPDADGVEFTFSDIPAGPARVQTWFYNGSGNRLFGAFYTYAQPDVIDVLGCMDTGYVEYDSTATMHDSTACLTLPVLHESRHTETGAKLKSNSLQFSMSGTNTILFHDITGKLTGKVMMTGPGEYVFPETVKPGVHFITVKTEFGRQLLKYVKMERLQ